MLSTVSHPELGDITVSRTCRARRISLSVRPPDKIRLSMPPSVSLKEAMKFVDSKVNWVRHTIGKYEHIRPAGPISMPYSTRAHSLVFDPREIDRVNVRIVYESSGLGRIVVAYPLGISYVDEQVQKVARKGVEEAWRSEAKKLLPMRVEELAGRLGLKYRSVTVRNTVSKWGSCSARNDLSLSLHLMRLPDHLIDYIILHELCHSVHKNHGQHFHQLLDQVTGGRHRELRRELKSYNPRW